MYESSNSSGYCLLAKRMALYLKYSKIMESNSKVFEKENLNSMQRKTWKLGVTTLHSEVQKD